MVVGLAENIVLDPDEAIRALKRALLRGVERGINGRIYDPQLARFTTADTAAPGTDDPQKLNLYTYTLDNPLAFIDPTGHQPMGLIGANFLLLQTYGKYSLEGASVRGPAIVLQANGNPTPTSQASNPSQDIGHAANGLVSPYGLDAAGNPAFIDRSISGPAAQAQQSRLSSTEPDRVNTEPRVMTTDMANAAARAQNEKAQNDTASGWPGAGLPVILGRYLTGEITGAQALHLTAENLFWTAITVGMALPAKGASAGAGAAVGETPGVGEYLAGKAPFQVSPGVLKLEGVYVNDLGTVQPWRAFYDDFGRLVGRTDYNAGNAPECIPDVHFHTYEWGPGMTPLETDSHIPGEYEP